MKKQFTLKLNITNPIRVLFLLILLFNSGLLKAQWVPQISNVSVGHFVQFLDAVDQNVVWGLVADPAQAAAVQEFTRTTDGGQTWAGGAITNATGLSPSCISAINADTAWVAMYSASGSNGKILKTTDGGASWVHQTTALFNATGNFPDFVYFWDADNGVCLGDPTLGYFEIYTTIDGGTNWVRTPSASIATQLGGEFGITDVFTHQGDSTIFFGTNLGRIYKTTDRGLNWSVSSTPFADFIGAIAFRDANNGLATSGGATGSTDIARTTDGGATWSLVGTNTAGMNLKLNMCYVPGTDSTYFISTPAAGSINGTAFSPNDGTSWLLVDNLIHSDIEFVNDSTGWTGSNELDAPMYKWSTPIVVAANDVLSQSIDVTANTGLITQSPQATFRNNGLVTQTFDVTMIISGGYSSTKTISNLTFNNVQQVTFDPWTPAVTGAYTVTIYTQLAADSNLANDTLVSSITVYEAFENYGWTSKPDVTAGTFGLASTFKLNGTTTTSPGQLFSIGGADFTAVQPVMNSFETASNSWSTVAPMPSPKYQFSAHRVGDNIYCAGGYSAGFTPDPNTYIYNITSNTWTFGSSMQVPVGDYASGVYMDSLIYYIGGFDGTADQNLVQIYNPANDTWVFGTAKPGTATSGIRGGLVNNTIVVAGGFSQTLANSIADAYSGVIDVSNPSAISWTALPDYPGGTVGRLGAGTPFQSLKPLVIFVGGDPNGSGAIVKGDCWGYDVSASQWKIGTQKTTAVSNISDLVGLVYNDSLWMASVSGYDGAAISTVNEWLNIGASPPITIGINENSAINFNSLVYPNPITNSTTIIFSISKSENVCIKIVDVTGRLIKSLSNKEMNEGEHRIIWNLSDDNNNSVNSGIYFLKIQAGAVLKTEKLVVTK